MWFPNRSSTNRAVQAQTASGWKFWIKKEEEFYYQCSENKGADQLCSYCEADLCLCFRICRLLVFPCGTSIMEIYGFQVYAPLNRQGHMEMGPRFKVSYLRD